MSYLLDALRKAERERKLGRTAALTLDAGHAPEPQPGMGVAWLLGALAALVVFVNAAAFLFFWPGGESADTDLAPAIAASAPPARSDTAADATPPAKESTGSAPPDAPRVKPSPVVAKAPEPSLPAGPAQPAKPIASLSPQQRAAIPDLEISGLLYSSIPGRSFVLINGRRYRQGERTQAGPAIVSINAQGVVLDYRGIRFRLPAPY